jgi:hypothetical protein
MFTSVCLYIFIIDCAQAQPSPDRQMVMRLEVFVFRFFSSDSRYDSLIAVAVNSLVSIYYLIEDVRVNLKYSLPQFFAHSTNKN